MTVDLCQGKTATLLCVCQPQMAACSHCGAVRSWNVVCYSVLDKQQLLGRRCAVRNNSKLSAPLVFSGQVRVHNTLVQVADADGVLSQSGTGFEPAPSRLPCGTLGAAPCPGREECQCGCGLYASGGECVSEMSTGPCPVRPCCGFENGPPCAFPGDRPCDECLEVDAVSGMCFKVPGCAGGTTPLTALRAPDQ